MSLFEDLEESTQVRKKIKKAVKVTQQTGFETGFSFCRPTKLIEEAPEELKSVYRSIYASPVVVGEEKSMSPPDLCADSGFLGTFHTHPNEYEPKFSKADEEAVRLMEEFIMPVRVNCIAGKRGKVVCEVNGEKHSFEVDEDD